ncbi:MAG TPA: drug/metabolite exporter YedA [Longimicrobiales bacterium]|nr:drug/metabolite exporter YedA [Longimicrobiales bacterium]
MSTGTVHNPAPRGKLIAAFAAIYIIWGSTYLAIRFALETLPPFLMAGARFLTAGAILYGVLIARGAEHPTRRNWRDGFIVGAFLLLGGNGGVVWAEQYVVSGIAALLVATMPIWIVVFDWLRGTGPRPAPRTMAGIGMGFLGLIILVGPQTLGSGAVPLIPALALVFASISWAWGSLYSRGAVQPSSPMMATAVQMAGGGVLLLLAGLLTGELGELDLAAVSARSLLALLYLLLAGSIVGYSAYIWLLRHATPAHVSTYAYVNPVVAVFLGWLLASEPITPRLLLAAAVIVGGVAVIVTVRGQRVPGRRPAGEPAE